MSDTASPSPDSPPSRAKGCACKLLVCLLVIALLAGSWVIYFYRASRSEQPLGFAAFRYKPLEKSMLTAKFEFLELPSRLLTGGPTEIDLSERELNALLFGEAGHRDDGEKVRVQIEGERLRIESSKPIDGEDAVYVNVVAVVELAIGPGISSLEIHEAHMGTYEFGPVSRPWLEKAFKKALAKSLEGDPRLARIKALSIEGGKVKMIYQPRVD